MLNAVENRYSSRNCRTFFLNTRRWVGTTRYCNPKCWSSGTCFRNISLSNGATAQGGPRPPLGVSFSKYGRVYFFFETLLLRRSAVVRRLGHCVRKMFRNLSKQLLKKETGVRECCRVLGGTGPRFQLKSDTLCCNTLRVYVLQI